MIHGHLEYMPLRANPERAEEFARQHIQYCRRQLRSCRRYRIKKFLGRLWTGLDRFYPLFVSLGTVAVFGSLIAFSAR